MLRPMIKIEIVFVKELELELVIELVNLFNNLNEHNAMSLINTGEAISMAQDCSKSNKKCTRIFTESGHTSTPIAHQHPDCTPAPRLQTSTPIAHQHKNWLTRGQLLIAHEIITNKRMELDRAATRQMNRTQIGKRFKRRSEMG